MILIVIRFRNKIFSECNYECFSYNQHVEMRLRYFQNTVIQNDEDMKRMFENAIHTMYDVLKNKDSKKADVLNANGIHPETFTLSLRVVLIMVLVCRPKNQSQTPLPTLPKMVEEDVSSVDAWDG